MLESFNFPESYRVNSTKEKLALSYAENFRKQFVHLYRDRKPLLLNPVNELQVEACSRFIVLYLITCHLRTEHCPYKITFALFVLETTSLNFKLWLIVQTLFTETRRLSIADHC